MEETLDDQVMVFFTDFEESCKTLHFLAGLGGVQSINKNEAMFFFLFLPGLDCKQGESGGKQTAAWGGGVPEGGGEEYTDDDT